MPRSVLLKLKDQSRDCVAIEVYMHMRAPHLRNGHEIPRTAVTTIVSHCVVAVN